MGKRRPQQKFDARMRGATIALLFATVAGLQTHGEAVAERPPAKAAVPAVRPQAAVAPLSSVGVEHGTVILADRRLLLRLAAVRDLLQKERFSEALPVLQQFLELPSDRFYFADPETKTIAQSVKTEVRTILAQLPPDGRRAYELAYGATARRLLNDAIETGDVAGLAAVARRFPATEAGLEAQSRLAGRHRDHGEPLAAIRGFQQVQTEAGSTNRWEPALSIQLALAWQALGQDEKAAEVLSALVERTGRPESINVGGRQVPFVKESELAVHWLARTFSRERKIAAEPAGNWRMPGGNAARNPVRSSGHAGIEIAWPQRGVDLVVDPLKAPDDSSTTPIDRQLQALVRQVEHRPRNGALPALPPGELVAVDETIVVRTLGNLRAVHLGTGVRQWETLVDESFERLAAGDGERSDPASVSAMAALVQQRLTQDMTFGRLSSDGQRVYAIEDLEPATTVPLPQQEAAMPRSANRLAAYDLRTGKLEWEVGGSPGPFVLELAGTFFLGPPLPRGGRLFVLAEVEREIRLLGLDAQNGTVEWDQPLIAVDTSIAEAAARRTAAVSPAYSDGILICPTRAGFVVAVDVAMRRLLWLYRLPALPFVEGGVPLPRRLARPIPRPHGAVPVPWHGTPLVIDGGNVVLAVDAPKSLVCLNLADGKELWNTSSFKSEPIAIGGIWQGRVLVAETDGISAISLADGTPAWNTLTRYPDGHQPSGRGVIVDGRLYVPLRSVSGGEVSGAMAIIDAVTGRLLALRPVLEGRAPGNLIAISGSLVSQGLSTLDVFSMRELDGGVTMPSKSE